MPRAAPAAAGGLALALVFRVNCAGPQAARAGGQAANQDQIGGGPATAFELAGRRGSPAAQEPGRRRLIKPGHWQAAAVTVRVSF